MLDRSASTTRLFIIANIVLPRIEDALEVNKIHYERLDGGMKREERNRSMDALKNDPRCEVLLGMPWLC